MGTKADILELLDLGSSVAENGENLSSYFIPTVALSRFLADRDDLILGAKGSGKSAILKVATKPSQQFRELQDVCLVEATEHTGEPAFKRAFNFLLDDDVDEARLVNAWKSYLLNLALDRLEQLPLSNETTAAIRLATESGIRDQSEGKFKKFLWSLVRFFGRSKIKGEVGGISAEVELANWPEPDTAQKTIDFPRLLELCCRAFAVVRKRCWLLIDRLDSAFQDKPQLERTALRSLLVAYKDFMGVKEFRPKIFFRTDLYDMVSHGQGFRELTHVQDRASPPITWDSDKLLHMIMERFAFNQSIREH